MNKSLLAFIFVLLFGIAAYGQEVDDDPWRNLFYLLEETDGNLKYTELTSFAIEDPDYDNPAQRLIFPRYETRISLIIPLGVLKISKVYPNYTIFKYDNYSIVMIQGIKPSSPISEFSDYVENVCLERPMNESDKPQVEKMLVYLDIKTDGKLSWAGFAGTPANLIVIGSRQAIPVAFSSLKFNYSHKEAQYGEEIVSDY